MNIKKFIFRRIIIIPTILTLVSGVVGLPRVENVYFGNAAPSLETSSSVRKAEILPSTNEVLKSFFSSRFKGYRSSGRKEKQSWHGKDFIFENIANEYIQLTDAFINQHKNTFSSFQFCALLNKAPPLCL